VVVRQSHARATQGSRNPARSGPVLAGFAAHAFAIAAVIALRAIFSASRSNRFCNSIAARLRAAAAKKSGAVPARPHAQFWMMRLGRRFGYVVKAAQCRLVDQLNFGRKHNLSVPPTCPAIAGLMSALSRGHITTSVDVSNPKPDVVAV
jgi:hypothetical protein